MPVLRTGQANPGRRRAIRALDDRGTFPVLNFFNGNPGFSLDIVAAPPVHGTVTKRLNGTASIQTNLIEIRGIK
jgi:hypothetical protein